MTDTAITELLARVAALEAWRTHQSDLLDDLINDRPHTPPAEIDLNDADEDVDPDSLIEWVQLCVTGIIARPLHRDLRWCPRWWEHTEAVFRLTALRRAWLELAVEPGTALSVWIRDHLDPCLRELLAPTGPFADCTTDTRFPTLGEHHPIPHLITEPPEH